MNRLIVLCLFLFLVLPGLVFAGPGFSGGVIFQQQDANTITASPTVTSTNLNVLTIANPSANIFNLTPLPLAAQYNAIKLQGTNIGNASPTANQMIWYSASGTAWIPVSVTAGSGITFTDSTSGRIISAPGFTGLSGNEASGTMDFNTVAPHDLEPGTADTTRHTVYLANTGNTAALFGAELLPDDWDAASDLKFKLLVATPVTAAVASVVFQVQYQIIKAGNALYSSSGFTIIWTFTKTLSSTTTAQEITDSNLKIAFASLAVNDRIHIVVKRAGSHANDTHSGNLHIVAAKSNYKR